jgi:hypothetical protein
MLPCAGKFAKAQDPPVPTLYSAALLYGRSSNIRGCDYSCSPGPDEGLQPWPSPPLTLVYDCSRILQAEASVGNLVAALRTCGLAREKLLKRSFCDSAKDDCGNASTDPIIQMLDRRLEDAKNTDIYRRLASEEVKVSTAPATK